MDHESRLIDVLAEQLRASGVLGRPGTMSRLFDYLLEQSREGRKPKELEIAREVLNRDGHFDAATDSAVRVYVHKLRRKLDEHYSRLPGQARLTIPKGEYRLVVESPPLAETSMPAQQSRRPRWTIPAGILQAALIASLLINVALLVQRWAGPAPATPSPPGDHPLWSSMLTDERPICIVVGDYYIFGETDDEMNIRRLVREFDINSPADLREYLYRHSELASRYQNLDLSYLPTSAAFALRELMPLLAASGKRIEIVQSSKLTAQVLKSAHVIYIGYLSGLGALQDLTLKHSRFKFGDSYDELVDRIGEDHYVSQAGVPIAGEMVYVDYGYISCMIGPNGARILLVAGLRDVGVMHSAELLANAEKLRELGEISHHGFEALYEVSAIDSTNLKGRLVRASELRGVPAASLTYRAPITPRDLSMSTQP